jgi:hypothetical protein
VRHQDVPASAHPLRDERRVGQGADAQREIEAAVDQVEQAVVEHEVHAHLGVGLREGAQRRHHVQQPERHRRVDAQHPARRGERPGGGLLRVTRRQQRALRVRQRGRPRLGQRQAPRRPLQQAHPEALLEPRHRHAHHRLRDPQPPRRSREALGLGHRREHGQILQRQPLRSNVHFHER